MFFCQNYSVMTIFDARRQSDAKRCKINDRPRRKAAVFELYQLDLDLFRACGKGERLVARCLRLVDVAVAGFEGLQRTSP